MSYNCPKCQSDKTQKFSSIYSSQTTHSRSFSAGDLNGVVVGGQGPGIVSGSTSTSAHTTNQSQLAAQLSPPVKKSEKWKLAAFILSPIVASLLWALLNTIVSSMNHYGLSSGTAILAYLGITGLLSYHFWSTAKKNKIYNQEVYSKQMKIWSEQFYCYRCENIFIPSERMAA